jgi:hypothetical protein
LIAHVPALTRVNSPSLVIVQTVLVSDLKTTAREEVDVATSEGLVPNVWVLGLLNVMVCVACGVIAAEAIEFTDDPAALVALTVNEYVVPFVNPGMVIGLAAAVTECPPTLEATV